MKSNIREFTISMISSAAIIILSRDSKIREFVLLKICLNLNFLNITRSTVLAM